MNANQQEAIDYMRREGIASIVMQSTVTFQDRYITPSSVRTSEADALIVLESERKSRGKRLLDALGFPRRNGVYLFHEGGTPV